MTKIITAVMREGGGAKAHEMNTTQQKGWCCPTENPKRTTRMHKKMKVY